MADKRPPRKSQPTRKADQPHLVEMSPNIPDSVDDALRFRDLVPKPIIDFILRPITKLGLDQRSARTTSRSRSTALLVRLAGAR
jgi:hypothetical protein